MLDEVRKSEDLATESTELPRAVGRGLSNLAQLTVGRGIRHPLRQSISSIPAEGCLIHIPPVRTRFETTRSSGRSLDALITAAGQATWSEKGTITVDGAYGSRLWDSIDFIPSCGRLPDSIPVADQ